MAFQVPVDPRAERRARNVGWAMTILSGLLIGLLVYLTWTGFQGSEELVHPAASTDCRLPSSLGMAYEAINYDIASDAALAAEADPMHCVAAGQPAGTALTTIDGIRIAGWYVPSGSGVGPAGPTVVLVHDHGTSKSAMLPWAALLHQDYNLVLFDLRNHGQSFGTATTAGLAERHDLEAVVAWVQGTKAPTWTGVLGTGLGGVAAAYAVASALPVQALVLDSVPASVSEAIQRRIESAGYPLALPGAWAVMLGSLFRTGMDISAADPILVIDHLGGVPVLIVQRDGDPLVQADSADRLAAEATADGVAAEVQHCAVVGEGPAIGLCADVYRDWVLGFLARSRAS